jgi:CBS domain-containing protein
MHEIAEFLGAHPPFDGLTAAELARVADAAEIEFHPKGEIIFAQGAAPVQHVRVVRTGAIELLDQDRVIDLLSPGEPFGHPSMLSGMPPGLGARAHEDTLCYRLPDPRPLLDDPSHLGFLPRSLLDHAPAAGPPPGMPPAMAIDPGQRPAGSLLRGPGVVLEPGDTIRDAARRMADAGQSCAVVALDGSVGIVTDRVSWPTGRRSTPRCRGS